MRILAVAAVAVAVPTLTIGAPTKVARQPGNPAVGFGSVWVPGSGSGELDRIDPKTGKVVTRIHSTSVANPPEGQYFDSVAVSKTAVWHASDAGNVVVRVNPRTNKVVAKIAVGGRPDEVAAGPAGTYIGLFDTSTVERISPATNKVVKKRNLPGPVMGVAYAGGKLWAVEGTTVLQLDPLSLAIKTRISVKSSLPPGIGFAPDWWMSGDAKTLCVGTLQQNAVTVIDPATGKVTTQVALPFGTRPFSVAADNGSCWATNDSGVFVVSADGTASAHLPSLGASIFTGVVADPSGAWVTLAGTNKLLRVTKG